MRGTKAPHQRFAEVTGAPGYEDRHVTRVVMEVQLRLLLRFIPTAHGPYSAQQSFHLLFAGAPNSKRALAIPFFMKGEQDTNLSSPSPRISFV